MFKSLTLKYKNPTAGTTLFVDHFNEINCFTFYFMYHTKIST